MKPKLQNNSLTLPTMASLIALMIALGISGCSPSAPAAIRTLEKYTLTITASVTVTPITATSTSTVTPPEPTPTPTISLTPEPAGCHKPSDDYELVTIDGHLFNQRTIDMLEYAQTLYGGEIDLTASAVTQGSFHDNGAASFGTHLGGGAVDLSVMRFGTWTVLYDDIPILLQALRSAGFAAWLREVDEVFPGSGIHIHAIAIGDRDLSEPAEEQLTGAAGYFRGFSGLPPVNDNPTLDRFGGPILCQWMLDAGYQDLRKTPAP